MLGIYTIQISVAGKLGHTSDLRYLDVTVKSGDKAFAPTWKMVMGFKEGRISEEEYTHQYHELMRESYRKNQARWDEILSLDEIILACYCRADSGERVSSGTYFYTTTAGGYTATRKMVMAK